jgi:PAS domain S-box-containing protein
MRSGLLIRGPTPGSRIRRYSVALAATVVALLLRKLLDPLLGDHAPFLTLYPAVVFLALYAGLGPSILSTIIGLLAVPYWLVEPSGFRVNDILGHLLSSLGFVSFSTAVIAVGEISRRSHREREKQADAELTAMFRLREVGMQCMRTGNDFKGCLTDILDTALFLTKAAKGNIHLLDSSSSTLVMVAHQGFEQPLLDFFAVMSNLSSIYAKVRESRRRLIVEDLLESKALTDPGSPQVLLEAGVRALQSTPLINSSGDFLGMISTHYPTPHRLGERELRLMDLLARQAADYLERKQAEEALAVSSAQLRSFLEAAPTGLTRCSRDLRFVSVNSAYAETVGLPINEIVGRPLVEVIGVEGWEIIWPYVQRVLGGERVEYETVVPYPSVGPRQLHVVYTPERSVHEVVGWVASITDITEFKRVEKQLHEMEKMAVAGQMAAALAHEINNPLESVTNVCYLLGTEKELSNTARRYIDIAKQELTRIALISKDLLGLYRQRTPVETFHVRKVVNDALEMLAPKIAGAHIRVVQRYEGLGDFHGSYTEVRQIILNIISNAIEAMDERGVLTVRASASRDWRNLKARGFRITIIDNGSGISRDQLHRIFEPFITTKSTKGTGLGLWVSMTIAHRYGGNIRVRSRTDFGRSGTCFTIFLPDPFLGRSENEPGTPGNRSLST